MRTFPDSPTLPSPGNHPEVDKFIAAIRYDEFCALASRMRGGVSCRIGEKHDGIVDVEVELIFADGVIWIARIPVPFKCHQPDQLNLSSAAMLRYLKRHSKVPVPEVLDYKTASAPGNSTGVAYTLMEKPQGHDLPADVVAGNPMTATDEQKAGAKKIYEQLADIVIELSAHKFDKIGALRESEDGTFHLVEYTHSFMTGAFKEQATEYEKLSSELRGPFDSASKFYSSMWIFKRNFTLVDPGDDDKDVTIAEAEIQADMVRKMIPKELVNGPFVPWHDGLDFRNFLVDDDYNITAVLSFPGVTMPLTSLCILPRSLRGIDWGLLNEEAYTEIFLKRDARNPSSLLASKDVRKALFGSDSAKAIQDLDGSLVGGEAMNTLPSMYEKVYGRKYDRKEECRRIASKREWFENVVPRGEDGLYMWERENEDGLWWWEREGDRPV